MLFLVAVACQSGPDDISLLELESLRFKAQNEEIRVEELIAEYDKRKARADRLSEQLLVLQRRKEGDYERYDAVRADLARLQREHAAAVEARDTASAALAAARGEKARLSKALEVERRAIAGLEAELAKLAAKRRALEEKQRADAPAE